jgi:hypothetical protein
MSRERRFLLAFFLTLVGASTAFAAFNVIVNPLGYYPCHRFRPLTWSSRETKVKLMRQAPTPATLLILGSSRTMKIAPPAVAALTGQPTFNASVDSALAEDYLALLAFALEDMKWPVHDVLLGLDLEAFHDHLAPDGRTLTLPALRDHMPLGTQLEMLGEALRAALSFNQLGHSLHVLRLTRAGFPPDSLSFDADGYLHEVAQEQALRDGTFKMELNLPLYSNHLAGFGNLDQGRLATFDRMLALAARHGVRVRAFLTPMHPALIAHLERSTRFPALHRQLVEAMTARASRTPGFSFRDFADVRSFGGSDQFFFDGVHTRDENARLMARALWEGP